MAIRLDMTMSVDGYVVGPDDSVDAPMGDGGFRLFNWLDRRNAPGPSGQVVAESSQLNRRNPPSPMGASTLSSGPTT